MDEQTKRVWKLYQEKLKKENLMHLSDQLAIERGLQIREYHGKWNAAKEIALRTRTDKYAEESAFELACRIFVELGGEMRKPFYDVLNSQVLIQPENT
ncbi:MAG: hypothetical protein M3Q99_07180 [Acidobacteriota bacterium]|nr:hypothetical protein [Acidobacteriota bacterium]